MSEQAIANVQASVMVYDDSTKKWIPSGSSGTQGISKVQIFHHLQNNTFRVVGRKIQDHEVVINCAINKGLNYNRTTKTFHQWRDKRQVYGLNFVSPDDAILFAEAMLKALEVVTVNFQPLNHCHNQSTVNQSTTNISPIMKTPSGVRDSNQHQNGILPTGASNKNSIQYRDSNATGQQYQQGQSTHHHCLSTSSTVSSSSTIFYQQSDEKTCSATMSVQQQIYSDGPDRVMGNGSDRMVVNEREDFWCTVTNVGQTQAITNSSLQIPVHVSASQQHHQRRSSQGSTNSALSSETSAILSNIYPSANQCENGRLVAQVVPSYAPPASLVPASTKCGMAAPAPPPPAPKPSTAVPVAPPLPTGLCFSASAAAVVGEKTPSSNLALAIASAKLRKTSVRQPNSGPDGAVKENRSASTGSVDSSLRISSSSQQHSSVISEMAATLARRRLMLQESASATNANGSCTTDDGHHSVESPTRVNEKESKKSWDSKNGKFDDKICTDSPRSHRKVPSGSSLSSQEEGALGLSIAPAHSLTGSAASLTNLLASGVGGLTLTSATGIVPQRSMSNGPSSTPNINGGCLSSLSSSVSMATSGAATATMTADRCGSSVTVEALETIKREIVLEIRAEIAKVKEEIIEGE